MHITHARYGLFPILLATLVAEPVAAACSADSGTQRQHLLELYTSEGCSSCPPADRYLSQLKGEAGVWPLAFHVDYWDHLGWPDRFAQPTFSDRQRSASRQNGSRFVYTPQFVLDGRDWRKGWGKPPWRTSGRVTADRLTLRLEQGETSTLTAHGTWAGRTGQIFLAISENNLHSQVATGENAGRRLNHDFVVRQLHGPLSPLNGHFSHTIQLRPGWKRHDLVLTAFAVQPDDGKVLQAVGTPLCRP